MKNKILQFARIKKNLRLKNLSSFIFHLSSKKGFTLVELLVVISIVAILSAVVMSNFTLARQKGRDARRKADIQSIQSALELYRSDINQYPTTYPGCGTALSGGSPSRTFMKKVPCDPGGTSYFVAGGTATAYTLRACLENPNDPDGVADAACTCSSGTTCAYKVNEP